MYTSYQHTTPQQFTYHQPKLVCIDCSKKLSSIGACCGNNKKYQMATKFYCCACLIKHFGRPKQVEKLDNTLCLACGETLFNEGMWNDIPGRGEMCDVFCQYTIFINDWVEKETPIEAAWRRAVQQLDSTLPEEIRTIKNNPPEPIKLNWNAEPVINFLKPEEFHEHYQNLASTREEQKQRLAQLNTKLCHHCLIPSDFKYCNNYDLIYNLPLCIIYTIPEEEKPISNCTLESELSFDSDSNSDNDNNKNNGFSSIQNSNDNDNDINSDSNFDSNYEQYIVLLDLTKE
ncbi:hypothetical protein G9A89_020185 [Geosiphon pyriformis]|nr:hypothetical protein G9A89_020185 [Geosiphon pyriformis]